MVLELAGDGALDGPVAAVVDAGGQLVDHQAVAHLEELDGEGTDVLQGLGQGAGGAFRLALEVRRHARRRGRGQAEDAVLVVVLDQGVEDQLAIPRTGADQGQFTLEVDEALQHAGHATEGLPRRGQVGAGGQAALALTVVAVAGSLEDGTPGDGPGGPSQIGGARDGVEGRRGDALLGQEALLAQAVLHRLQGGEGRVQLRVGGGSGHGGQGQVLEFVGDDVAGLAQAGGGIHVIVGAADLGGDAGGGRVLARVQHGEAGPQGRAGLGQHLAQLAATEDADAAADHGCTRGSGWARTSAVCLARKARRGSRSCG